MPVSNEDTDDLVDRVVREIRTEEEEGERSNVVAKVRKLNVYKDRIYQRLKDIESYIDRKSTNYKFFTIQKNFFIRYILSLNEIDYFVRYNQISNNKYYSFLESYYHCFYVLYRFILDSTFS